MCCICGTPCSPSLHWICKQAAFVSHHLPCPIWILPLAGTSGGMGELHVIDTGGGGGELHIIDTGGGGGGGVSWGVSCM